MQFTNIGCVDYCGDSLKAAQAQLIKAAIASSATKRFVPSTFAIAYPRESVNQLPLLAGYFEAIKKLRKSRLQWTVFLNGCFLDYWGNATHRPRTPASFGIDIAHRKAAIPSDGNSRITFTYSLDVARFVIASLDLDEWPEESRIAGDVLRCNGLVSLAEETLRCKFTVTYDDIERLKNSQMTELPSQIACYDAFP